MSTTFQLNESELNSQFLDGLKLLFKNQYLTFTVEAEPLDTTQHLMSNSMNRERLLESVRNINNETNLTEISIDELNVLADA
jgi:hypothetical protein